VLAFYVIAVIVESTSRQPGGVATLPPYIPPPVSPPAPPRPVLSPTPSATPTVALPTPQATPAPPPAQTQTPLEPRTLLASQGAILKFVFGVPYSFESAQRVFHLAACDAGQGRARVRRRRMPRCFGISRAERSGAMARDRPDASRLRRRCGNDSHCDQVISPPSRIRRTLHQPEADRTVSNQM